MRIYTTQSLIGIDISIENNYLFAFESKEYICTIGIHSRCRCSKTIH